MSRRAATLDATEPPTVAMLHPAAGSGRGVEPGAPVAVQPRRGPIVLADLAVRADPSLPEDSVSIPSCLVEVAADLPGNATPQPYGKHPEFKYCAVRVRAVATVDGR